MCKTNKSCDFSVSPSPFGLDFGTLDFWTSDSGLTIKSDNSRSSSMSEHPYQALGPGLVSKLKTFKKCSQYKTRKLNFCCGIEDLSVKSNLFLQAI